jgi:hypothetical protein
MQVQNRFQPIRFGGPKPQRSDAGQMNDTLTLDSFGEPPRQGPISLPNNPVAHKKRMDTLEQKQKEEALNRLKMKAAAEANQHEAKTRMAEDLTAIIIEKEKERTQLLRELALPAFEHSLLTQKNLIIEHGGVENENWEKEMRQLNHPPKQVRNWHLEPLLNTKKSIWSTLGFDTVRNLYHGVMGNMATQEPDPLNRLDRKTTCTEGGLAEISKNQEKQKQIEKEMEQFIKDKLRPLEIDLSKTRAEAREFQKADQQQALSASKEA